MENAWLPIIFLEPRPLSELNSQVTYNGRLGDPCSNIARRTNPFTRQCMTQSNCQEELMPGQDKSPQTKIFPSKQNLPLWENRVQT